MRLFTFLTLLFCAATGLQAQEVTLLQDIFPGGTNSSPNNFFQYGDKTLFRAGTENEGTELWITDGTAAGTMLVKDINDDPSFRRGNSNPNNFTEYQGKVYFTAGAPGTGSELWVTDGTSDGTQLVKDIQPDEGSGNPFDFIVFNDLIYFTANNGNDANSSELWVSDGTEAGTNLVVDINPGGPGNPINKFEYLGFIFFAGNDGVNGRELWFTDGTAEGTEIFFDINPGPGNSNPSDFLDFGGRLMFAADNGTIGRELYNFNAVANTIGPIFDLLEGEDSSRPDNLFAVGNRVFYTGQRAAGVDGLHFVDFTAGSIFFNVANQNGPSNVDQVTEIVPGRAYVMVADTGAVEDQSSFLLVDNLTGGLQIEADEDLFGDLGGLDPQDLVFTGSSLYFSYESDATGRELAGVDLFAEGATPVRFNEVAAGASSGEIDDIHLLGTQLIFEANDQSTGRELYTADINAAYVNLETEGGETIANGDTLDFGDINFGEIDSLLAILNNTGNADALFLNFTGLFDTEIILPQLVNADRGEATFLPPAPDNAYLRFLVLPQQEGAFVDTALVSFVTASGPNSIQFFVTGNVIAPSVEAFADDVRILRGDTMSFADTPVGQGSVRALTFNNSGAGDFVIFEAELTEGDFFSIPTDVTARVATDDSFTLPITFSATTDVEVRDSLLVSTNIGQFAVVLTGSSNAAPDITVVALDRNLATGDGLEFLDVPARTDSTVIVTVSNPGTATLVIDSIRFADGQFFSTTADMLTLAVNEVASFPLTFSPTEVATVTDLMTLYSNAGDFEINLSGMSIVNSVVDRGLPVKRVFPNPTTGVIRVELESPVLTGQFRVTNAVGQVLQQGNWPEGQLFHDLDLSNLSAGPYQVEVISGAAKMTARVMKR
ncbi:T9SS type A sorting domain-containing protein [Lewinella sp. 4G2]|uniref:T9SS type A sorting domain-containing protein n=1 Tax=Lewinella sp. 4G2 TaxID=1803372 RepID=UPI0007B4CE4B|nr:T9SS type A sorting domain-containing protein [Lewinella sp. 4G2]OAV43992.1 hypothetical protein A3850_005555 [Lewinella sp. 4G2]